MESPAVTAPGQSPNQPRTAGILTAIRSTFAAKGFDGTSMNDLARAAGMSVGNFYRYFPSKTAIVEALVAQDVDEVRVQFQAILAAPDKMAALRAGIAQHLEETGPDDCRLAAEISASALRQSEISTTCQRMEETVCDMLLEVFAAVSGLSPETCRARFSSQARFVVLVLRGYGQRSDLSPDPMLSQLIRRSIDQILDDIPLAPAHG
ncbi:TetR/AcrR family transcriptional regulator [Rhodobacter sp. 24-YEA-8]|uniref:TetR/AcrR family transcriptional regulator n=1 Tax=Rhodobacter sp. 24-YEA-8 TaxID=1884310 RepID=UPI000896E389|nr:TetR/AcrR family transcriptional regulator [Rhodobacter sp. 24-YEA-8]SEB98149.1 transcriptional regulator, TetR family [Rhodobacter sp. 24-YEA-8]